MSIASANQENQENLVRTADDDDEESDESTIEEQEEEETIKWVQIIFLPFQSWWKILMLFFVCLKCILGPLTKVFPLFECWDVAEKSDVMFYMKWVYSAANPIYLMDTFLHIVHRQVQEEAMKHAYLPKPAMYLFLDMISVLPVYEVLAADRCTPPKLIPNIFGFTEFTIVYRIAEYFSLSINHNFINLFTGYFILAMVTFNAFGCLHLLWTFQGYCSECHKTIYDWRFNYLKNINNSNNTNLDLYGYAVTFIISYTTHHLQEDIEPYTYAEIFLVIVLMLLGFVIKLYVIYPKFLSEWVLRLNQIFTFHPRAKRIAVETARRNPSPTAYRDVEKFFAMIWKKRHGITSVPKAMNTLPKFIEEDIEQDLVWPFFYHSPTFRRTSESYKRWLGKYIHIMSKQAKERFFVGPHCFTNIYYIKSGIVQLISPDDSSAPLLSMSSGTIFGDISFYIPPNYRKISVRCLTYCEVLAITRKSILESLHKFPDDRRLIMKLVQERVTHAKQLYKCKKNTKVLDRNEHESINWIKTRWWEVAKAVRRHQASKDKKKIQLPQEEKCYHCPKYLGQIVLCKETKLQKRTMFTNFKFPWILSPESLFVKYWQKLVLFTVYMVVILHPPNIVSKVKPLWFFYFKSYSDIIFILDVFISCSTGFMDSEKEINFISLLILRLKDKFFHMDVLATPLLPTLFSFTNNNLIVPYSQFCRLFKAYMIFTSKYHLRHWNSKTNRIFLVFVNVVKVYFVVYFVMPHLIFVYTQSEISLVPQDFFFGKMCLPTSTLQKDSDCISYIDLQYFSILAIPFGYCLLRAIRTISLESIGDSWIMTPKIFLELTLGWVLKYMFLSALYLRYRESTNYQFFVTKLKSHYHRLNIHPDLLRRLVRYLECHWKHFHGVDIIQPHILRDEPYDIYWKLHGEIAERIISKSPAFQYAAPGLIRDLAEKAKFLILPKGSTLLMLGSEIENVTWIVNGSIKCEYQNDENETVHIMIEAGNSLDILSIILRKPAIRTYTAASDIEVLYLEVSEFFLILKHYPHEYEYANQCDIEIRPVFDEMFKAYMKKHKSYKKRLQDKIFHAKSLSETDDDAPKKKTKTLFRIFFYFRDFRKNPESRIMQHWLCLRAIVVLIQTTSKLIHGFASRFFLAPVLFVTIQVCRSICFMDIIMKMFHPYYDERGLVITNIKKCAFHYMTRGLVADLLGVFLSWSLFVDAILQVSYTQTILFGNIYTVFHFYLLIGYLHYIADRPSSFTVYVKIITFQILFLLSCIYVWGIAMLLCVEFNTKAKAVGNDSSVKDTCWMPTIFFHQTGKYYDLENLRLTQVAAFHFTQTTSMSISSGMLHVQNAAVPIFFIDALLEISLWVQKNYCSTFLLLLFRGDTVFLQGVNQLKKFLKDERVESKIIERSMNYFEYWWKRTAGVDMKILLNDRISAVFRQDLNYYFFRKTLQITDKLLKGGELFKKKLARSVTESYFLPDEDIIRQKHLSEHVYIVHRGKVSVIRDSKEIVTLGKGSIFGQLDGDNLRPLRVTVRSSEYTDVLMLSVPQFQSIMGDEVRNRIKESTNCKFDFMALKKHAEENPYNSVKYLLRGNKILKLPLMSKPVMSDTSHWYARWLLLVWVLGPMVSVACAVFIISIPISLRNTDAVAFWLMASCDILHFLHLFSDFFTLELLVHDERCVYRYVIKKKLSRWWLYLDLLSLLIPFVTLYDHIWSWQLARLLRFHNPVLYYKQFCRSFKDQNRTMLLKIALIVLVVHTMTCGWIIVACRRGAGEKFPIDLSFMNDEVVKNQAIDYTSWTFLDSGRIGGGCARFTERFYLKNDTSHQYISFLVPTDWRMDYVIALLYIISILTYTNLEITMPVNVKQYGYKIMATYIIYVIELWVSCMVMSAIYTKFQELYKFEYSLRELLLFLKQNLVSKYLIEAISTYFNLLWQKQKGCWLPPLTNQAPLCLREDIMSGLYMHHLLSPSLFRHLPNYFLEQICVKLKRVVYFPGKYIVQEGNIKPIIYFIHEGEVEKWFTDRDGDQRLGAVLTMNNYFGMVPGLFPNTPYQFSYYTRTVVDMVYLVYYDWQDILSSYPDLKFKLYMGAMKMKKNKVKHMASGTSLVSGRSEDF